jgi:hypothetical protein
MKKPVLIYSDEASDMGRIAEENNFGFFARSDSTTSFVNAVKRLSNNQMILNKMGHNGFNFMIKNYTTTISYKKIMESRKKVCN